MSDTDVVLEGLASEDDMIAAFLRAEIDSPLHSGLLLAGLEELGLGTDIVNHPDCTDRGDNDSRRAVLTMYRGWGTYESVFGGLPTETVVWWWAQLTRAGSERVEVIQWLVDEYPDAFPVRSLVELRALKQEAWRAVGDSVSSTAAAIRSGVQPAPPILISTPELERLVILEGHTRMQAYALLDDEGPDAIEVIIGTTSDASLWSEW